MKKKLTAWLLMIAMVFGLAACGSGEEENTTEFVYVPTYISMPEAEENISVIELKGTDLFYVKYNWGEEDGNYQEFYKMDLSVENPVSEKLNLEFENYNQICFDSQQNVYVADRVYETREVTDEYGNTYTEYDYDSVTMILAKYASDGTELFRKDITAYLNEEEGYSPYVQYMEVDKDGNVYVTTGEQYIWVFDQNGDHLCTVQNSGWIHSMGCSKDGEVYITTSGMSGSVLRKVDVAAKDLGEELKGLPGSFYGGVRPGAAEDFLLVSDTALYGYSIEKQESTEILKFLDADMAGSYVEEISITEDGRIFVYYRDWNLSEEEIIVLEKKDSSEIKEKTILTLGGMNISQDLQSAVVKFNKSNEEYRITIKDYYDSVSDSTSYQDAIALMNSDLITGNAPDLIDLSNVNIQNLAAKGILADLTPYLESSSQLKREDLIESVLTAYTCSDVLCAIPTGFQIGTLMSAASIVGDKMGWTIDELIAAADKMPEDAIIMEYATKDSILQYMMLFGADTFVDWESGKCNFTGDEFIKVLEFANRFDKEYNYSEDDPVMPELVEAGKLLLVDQSISSVSDFQIIQVIWGEKVTCIGFPSAAGNGSVLQGENAIAVSSQSKYKEAAWSFLESFILGQTSGENGYMWNFSITKEGLAGQIEEAMEPQYQTDWTTGEYILDENGEKIEYSKGGWGFGNGVEYDIYAATQEEADQVMELINTTTTLYNYDTQLFNIVSEEAAYYFDGQKSAQEVAKVIQGRVQTYVDENR